MKKETTALLSATAIAIGTCAPALAIDVPEPGGQSGSGATTLKLITDSSEYGGTEIETGDFANPDADGDGRGDNLAFTAPSALTFIVKANGDLMCPSASATYIENDSAYGVHVSSLEVDQASGWNLVEDAVLVPSSTANAISMNVGPAMDSAGKVNLFSAKSSKLALENASKWGMDSKDSALDTDRLHLAFDGHAKNISEVLSSATSCATIHWYLSAGGEGEAYAEELAPTSQMVLDSAAIRSTETDPAVKESLIAKYTRNAQVGSEIDVTLATDTIVKARLVDVRDGKGLVFMFEEPISTRAFNKSGNGNGGWPASDLRNDLNLATYTDSAGDSVLTNTVFSTYLDGIQVDGSPAEVASVEVSSYSKDVDGIVTSNDKFWLPSMQEVYGAWREEENSPQFLYFASRHMNFYDYYPVDQPDPFPYADYSEEPCWWLRSLSNRASYGRAWYTSVADVSQYAPSSGNTDATLGVIPCFCL